MAVNQDKYRWANWGNDTKKSLLGGLTEVQRNDFIGSGRAIIYALVNGLSIVSDSNMSNTIEMMLDKIVLEGFIEIGATWLLSRAVRTDDLYLGKKEGIAISSPQLI